jgi:hypothetical protein
MVRFSRLAVQVREGVRRVRCRRTPSLRDVPILTSRSRPVQGQVAMSKSAKVSFRPFSTVAKTTAFSPPLPSSS